MRFEDCPAGMFLYNDELCFKTKYGFGAYVVSTGERFWGGAYVLDELRNLDVVPVEIEGYRKKSDNV